MHSVTLGESVSAAGDDTSQSKRCVSVRYIKSHGRLVCFSGRGYSLCSLVRFRAFLTAMTSGLKTGECAGQQQTS